MTTAQRRTKPTISSVRRWLAGRIDPKGREAADKVYRHLKELNTDLYEQRYTSKGPCAGCFQAVYDYEWRATHE